MPYAASNHSKEQDGILPFNHEAKELMRAEDNDRTRTMSVGIDEHRVRVRTERVLDGPLELGPIRKDPRQLRTILVTVCIALMAVIASVTGLNVAQPQLAHAYGASQSSVLWMINVYTLSLAALLLPLGALGDRWGRKRMLLLGLVVFGAASALSGLATSSGMMLAARFMSGVGAAMIMPITLAVITSVFPSEARAKAIGIWTGVAGGGGILGMYLSAILVDLADWRWLFVLPVALVVVAIVLAVRSIPEQRERMAHPFDAVGSVLSMIAVFSMVYALHEAPTTGLGHPSTLVASLLGIIGLTAFVWWEFRRPGALLDVRLFRKRALSSGSITLLTVLGVQAGIMVVLFPFFQGVLGWSGLRSTFAMLPMAVLMMASAAMAPKLVGRIGMRSTVAIGIILEIAAMALMATLVSVDDGYLSVLPGLLAMGVGMGLIMTPSTKAITDSLPPDQQGVASALNDVTRELGTALGVALLGTLVTTGYGHAITTRLHGFPEASVTLARDGLINALGIANDMGSRSATWSHLVRESFVDGWQHAMWVGVAVMIGLLGYVLLRGQSAARGIDAHSVDDKHK
jgi:EmrB/QacA subfamily drug resistance transporter